MTTYRLVISVGGRQRTVTIRAGSRSAAVESARMMYGGSLISAEVSA